MRGPSMKKKNAATEYRTPLFDRLFKPQMITLPNGHTVEPPLPPAADLDLRRRRRLGFRRSDRV